MITKTHKVTKPTLQRFQTETEKILVTVEVSTVNAVTPTAFLQSENGKMTLLK